MVLNYSRLVTALRSVIIYGCSVRVVKIGDGRSVSVEPSIVDHTQVVLCLIKSAVVFLFKMHGLVKIALRSYRGVMMVSTVVDQLVSLANLTTLWSLSWIKRSAFLSSSCSWLCLLHHIYALWCSGQLCTVRIKGALFSLFESRLSFLHLDFLRFLLEPGLTALIHALIECFGFAHPKFRRFPVYYGFTCFIIFCCQILLLLEVLILMISGHQVLFEFSVARTDSVLLNIIISLYRRSCPFVLALLSNLVSWRHHLLLLLLLMFELLSYLVEQLMV